MARGCPSPSSSDSRPVAVAPAATPLFLEGKPVLLAPCLAFPGMSSRRTPALRHGLHVSLRFLPLPPPRSSAVRLAQPRSFPTGVQTAVEEPVSGGSEEGAGVEAEDARPCSVAAFRRPPTPDLAWTTLDLPCTFVHCVCFLGEPPLGAGDPVVKSLGTRRHPLPRQFSSLPASLHSVCWTGCSCRGPV